MVGRRTIDGIVIDSATKISKRGQKSGLFFGFLIFHL